eukprot:2795904-Prorocentrum_lima.AAC.1
MRPENVLLPWGSPHRKLSFRVARKKSLPKPQRCNTSSTKGELGGCGSRGSGQEPQLLASFRLRVARSWIRTCGASFRASE